jgi:hypothetical protein
MKYLLAIWAAPPLFFWSWYFLSLNDINFGSVYLSRRLHVLIMEVFALLMNTDPASVPGLMAEACAFDALLLAAIWAFRRRRELSAWANERYARYAAVRAVPLIVEAQSDERNA